MGYYEHDNHADDCQDCGKRLTGRQERFCSAACRQAGYRASKKPRKPIVWKICPLCGETFEATHPLKKYCDYSDEAERDCQDAQDDLEEAQWIAEYDRKNATCAHCGEPAGWSGHGRPRRFCSNRCKTADYRKRRAA
ncbi:hypothetical protein AB0A70_00775 [Streptomyces morookaense]|uniref:hypothetical protein n=1 Tax=Streptomyces morookaense TaxID=1970 RepID=UPI0033CF687F